MTGGNYLELLETRFKNWSSCKTRPVPSATALNGSSAIWTGKPVSSATSRSMPRNNAPPPAITIPRSTKSADNSGGQRSRVMRTDSKMLDSGSCTDYFTRMSAAEIIDQVQKLPPKEVFELSQWLREYEADLWDKQIEADIR